MNEPKQNPILVSSCLYQFKKMYNNFNKCFKTHTIVVTLHTYAAGCIGEIDFESFTKLKNTVLQ